MKVFRKKITPDGTKIGESINDSETEYASAEDPLSIHRTASNETNFISEILDLINEKNVIIAPGQGRKLISILRDEILSQRVNLAIILLGLFQ